MLVPYFFLYSLSLSNLTILLFCLLSFVFFVGEGHLPDSVLPQTSLFWLSVETFPYTLFPGQEFWPHWQMNSSVSVHSLSQNTRSQCSLRFRVGSLVRSVSALMG